MKPIFIAIGVTAVAISALGILGRGLAEVHANDGSISLSHPKTAETVRCHLGADRIYRFSVTGVLSSVADGQVPLLWVMPSSPKSETRGWYLQRGPNGIKAFDTVSGKFDGIGQIGNPQWPAHDGDTLAIAVTAVDSALAEELLSEGGVVVRRNLPGSGFEIAQNVRVQM